MNKDSTRYYSNRQERRVANTLNGKVVSNSGAGNFVAGDVITGLFLVECKTSTTPKKSVSIKREWLDKLEEEAFAMCRPYKALAFDFGEGDPYYIVDTRTFLILQSFIQEEEDEDDE